MSKFIFKIVADKIKRKCNTIFSIITLQRLFIFTCIIFAIVGDTLYILNCDLDNNKQNKFTQIEETVLLHEEEIVKETSDNYDKLKKDYDYEITLEFDDVDISINNDSDDKIKISAKSYVTALKYDKMQYTLTEDNYLEKVEEVEMFDENVDILCQCVLAFPNIILLIKLLECLIWFFTVFY